MGRGASSYGADLFLRWTTSFPFGSNFNVKKLKLVFTLCYLSMTPVVVMFMVMESSDRGWQSSKANSTRRLLNYIVHFSGIAKNIVSIIHLIRKRKALQDASHQVNRIRSELLVEDMPKKSKLFTMFNLMYTVWLCEQVGSNLTLWFGFSFAITLPRIMAHLVDFINTQFFFSLIAQILTFHEALRPLYWQLLKHHRADVTMRLYLDITWTSEQFLQAYSLIIFLNVFWFFLWALNSSFDIQFFFFTGSIQPSWNPIVYYSVKVWVLVCFIDICASFVLLLQAISLSKNQEEIFNDALYWKMTRDKTNEFRDNEFLKFHFMVRKETEITACGFFKLDNSLLCSMLESATTYLVIVFQYSTNPETSTDEPTTLSSVQQCLNSSSS